jgi:hypothetical protein
MRKSTFSLALALLVAIIWLGVQSGHPRAAEDSKPAVRKWEYRISQEVGRDASVLNPLGNEGWEMCGVGKNPNDSFFVVYFKRPKQ